MQEHDELNLASELPAPSAAKKKKRVLPIIFDIAMVVVTLVCISVSVNVVYINATYNLPFYVNGVSMYPTFNQGCVDRNGKPLTWNSGSANVGDQADYGWAKTEDKGDWRSTLTRNDIVITYYPEDYEKDALGNFRRDADGKLILRSKRATKVKRLIGFPGERVKYETCTDDGEDHNRVWGKTTINPGTEKAEVLKPLYSPKDFPAIQGVSYNYPTGLYTYADVTLGENEYYVMGDNRGYSSDSRNKGPVTSEMIVGKVYLVVGKVTIDDLEEPSQNYWYYFVPWVYRRIAS